MHGSGAGGAVAAAAVVAGGERGPGHAWLPGPGAAVAGVRAWGEGEGAAPEGAPGAHLAPADAHRWKAPPAGDQILPDRLEVPALLDQVLHMHILAWVSVIHGPSKIWSKLSRVSFANAGLTTTRLAHSCSQQACVLCRMERAVEPGQPSA